MTTEQILREQIAELEKLLKLKDARIMELTTALQKESLKPSVSSASPPSVSPNLLAPGNTHIVWNPCQHAYSRDMHQTWPRKCVKCGAYETLTVQCNDVKPK